MWVLVLTAAPGRGLSGADLDTARRACGEAGEPRSLGPDAAEIPCPERPQPLSLPGIDATALPAEGREKRVLVADMDSTVIACECIDEIAELAGVGAEVAAITARAMAGELDFEGALAARVALLAGHPEALLERVWTERVSLTPGARALVRTMAARGAATALVSGGFTFFTERVAAAVGFAEHRANRLEIDGGRLTGRTIQPVLGRAAKAEALAALAGRMGVALSETMAVGDGANDLAMVEAAGLGVGYRPHAALAAKADAIIAHGDLSAALHLQGLHRDEFVAD